MTIQNGEQARLLDRVRAWFDAPEQVQHYQDEVRSGPTEAEEWLLHRLPAGGRVLDLGCGAGRIAVALARRGFEVTGVDVSAPLLEVATSIAARERLSAHLYRARRTVAAQARRVWPTWTRSIGPSCQAHSCCSPITSCHRSRLMPTPAIPAMRRRLPVSPPSNRAIPFAPDKASCIGSRRTSYGTS